MSGDVPVVLSIGSNLGDREHWLRFAVAALAATPDIHVVAASGIVESAAHVLEGVTDPKPAYLNAALAITTTLPPEALLDAIAAIEAAAGRVRIERWGDRTLDVDIVTYGDRVVDTDRLTIPHPRASERTFVLQPWLELDPGARLSGGPVAGLLSALSDPLPAYPAAPLLTNA